MLKEINEPRAAVNSAGVDVVTAGVGSVTIWALNPETALEILDRNRYGDQRKIVQSHVNHLQGEMEAGRFEQLSELKFATLPDGRSLMINGYHRLFALAQIDDPKFTINFTVTEVYAESEDKVARLYGREDIGKSRNYTDNYGAFKIYDDTDMNRSQINATAGGVRMILGQFRGSRVQLAPEVMIEHLRPWLPIGEKYFACIGNGAPDIKKRLRRVPVVGIALLTYQANQNKARSFWREIAQDDGLRRGDPRKTFVDWLVRNTQSGGGAGNPVSAKDMARYTARAWFHFYNGRDVTRLQISKKHGAITKVAGTDYTF